MENSNIKLACASPALRLLDTVFNTDNLIRLTVAAYNESARVILFPELSITGATGGDMYLSEALTASAEKQLIRFIEETKSADIVSFVGLPVRAAGNVYNCMAAICCGRILGVAPRSDLPRELGMRSFSEPPFEAVKIKLAGFDVPFYRHQIFDVDGVRLRIAFDPFASRALGASDADVTLIPTALKKTVGSYDRLKRKISELSLKTKSTYAVASAGNGESGTDALYDAQNVIARDGLLLAQNHPFTDEVLIFADMGKERGIPLPEKYGFSLSSPFMPEGYQERRRVCEQIFEIQARALAGRIKRAYARCTVIGVSGGLDSTLAVLVAVRAADILGMDRSSVKAVTMPCFGTTARTRSNAERLSLSLGTDFKTVDIKRAVTVHFEDIGHNIDDYGVVYENAQARERTQVIMDIANAEGGIVIGTGDLSELVLGWATYNGDHMSMYAVNAGIPKTAIRHVVAYCADKFEQQGDTETAEILHDVLNTPVSPELLPPKDGEIAQCTEGIVGPYELHDFFLYHLLKSALSPSAIYALAKTAFFGTEYTPGVIKGWLRVFFRRFFAQQFKRSCLPDGPMIYDIGVSPRGGLVMPSDASSSVWLEEIDTLD